MREPTKVCLVAAAAVMPLDGVLVGAAGLPDQWGDWPFRLGLLAVAAGLACAWEAYSRWRRRNEVRQFERYLDAIERLDWYDLANAADSPAAPLPRTGPWRRLTRRIGQTLGRQGRRLAELEQTRTALEIRCQRTTAQYEQIKKILAGVGDPILVVNDYDELLLANPAAAELFAFDASSTEKRALAQLVRCQRLVELLTDSAHSRAPGHRAEELEVVDAQGRTNWYRVYTAGLADSENQAGSDTGSPAGAVAVLRDIGAQKALQKRNAEFVSSVSHEMKAPLAGIRAYVELLVDGDAEDEATREEFLQVINSQADRLQRLVDNLLNLARIEAGVVQVRKQSRPLNELLEEAARVVQPLAEARRIELVCDFSPLYLGVLADRDMLLQAAINLLSNAIKYTPEGGRVTLRSRSAGDEVLFEVEDTGVGLSEEDSRRVFEKFYRVKKDQGMASGTGLGLPLAKHVVEDVHGGRLTVKSTLGVGSTFSVTLPTAAQMK